MIDRNSRVRGARTMDIARLRLSTWGWLVIVPGVDYGAL